MIKLKNAIVLCSGGIDSVVTAYYVKKSLKYPNLIILFFNYGQKSLNAERKASKVCANNLKAHFKEMNLSVLSKISTSLINKTGKVNKLHTKDLKDTREESKKWYVPARNLVFLSYALSITDSYYVKNHKMYDIFVGFKCEGKESYPDTTKEFVKNMNRVAQSSLSVPLKVKAPLINLDKEDIIKLGLKLGVNFKETFSCFTQKTIHCGYCLACKLRQAAFYWSNLNDPTQYSE